MPLFSWCRLFSPAIADAITPDIAFFHSLSFFRHFAIIISPAIYFHSTPPLRRHAIYYIAIVLAID